MITYIYYTNIEKIIGTRKGKNKKIYCYAYYEHCFIRKDCGEVG